MIARTLLAVLCCIATQCATLPIRGKVCYKNGEGEVCVGADRESVVIEGNFTTPGDAP